jgi:FkbM family methyltransferase
MAQVRLGQSIRNAIVAAQPQALTADVYPPVATADAPPRQKSAPGRARAPQSGAPRADLERTLIDVRSGLAQVAALCASLHEQIHVLGDATDLARRDMAALRQDMAALRQDFSLQREQIEAARASIWRRCDELEIKVRPMIPFDADSWAIRLAEGYAMVPRSEPYFAVMMANAGSGGLEPGTRQVLKALIEPGMVAADVGANVGLLTLACAFAAGPGGRVHAFEPEAGPRSQLAKSLKLNGLSWVETHDCALGARTESRPFHISSIIGHSSLYPLPSAEADHDETVPVRALDDVLGPGATLDVVKIDVEGAELDVLAGMAGLLAANADIAIVVEFGPSHLQRVGIAPQAWFAAFAACGFEAWAIDEATGACRGVTLEDVADVESVNLAFVRPGGSARDRLPMEPGP